MSLFKNEVGRPTNEIKKKRKIIILLFIVILIFIIGIISGILKNNTEDNSRNNNFSIISDVDVNLEYTANTLGKDVNEKLENVYVFNYYVDDKGLTINAINKENKIINIVNLKNNNTVTYEEINSVSYDMGKLYYYITTKESYNHEYLYYVDLDYNIPVPIQYSLYYADDATATINCLNLETYELNTILSDEFSISLENINKNNNKLYYNINNGKIMEYDIETKQNKALLDGTSAEFYGNFIMYRNGNNINSYNIINGENKVLGDEYETCIPTSDDYLCNKNKNDLYLYNSGNKIGQLDTPFGFMFNGLLENNMISIDIPGDTGGTKIIDFSKKTIYDSESLNIVGSYLYYVNN